MSLTGSESCVSHSILIGHNLQTYKSFHLLVKSNGILIDKIMTHGDYETISMLLVALGVGRIEKRPARNYQLNAAKKGTKELTIREGEEQKNKWHKQLSITNVVGQSEQLKCDVCGSVDVIEAPHMGRNCNDCNPL